MEGIISRSGYTLITPEQLEAAKRSLLLVLAGAPELDVFIRKINSSQPAQYVWKQELPKLFAKSDLSAGFNVDEFVDRVFLRRNKSSHGGRHVNEKLLEDSLVSDTMLLTAIYAIVESGHIGLDAQETLKKFRASFNMDLPLITKQ